jgi:hypothetical protein
MRWKGYCGLQSDEENSMDFALRKENYEEVVLAIRDWKRKKEKSWKENKDSQTQDLNKQLKQLAMNKWYTRKIENSLECLLNTDESWESDSKEA